MRCDLIAPLLPRVADGDGEPAETDLCGPPHQRLAPVAGSCSRASGGLSDDDRNGTAQYRGRRGLFSKATVMDLLPAKLQKAETRSPWAPAGRHRRRSDSPRNGVRKCDLDRQVWDAGIPSAAPPSLPADIADPAAGEHELLLHRWMLMALQSVVEAPLRGIRGQRDTAG